MKKYLIFSMLLFAAVLTLGSCATIIHGSRQSLEFASRPTGARLYLDGKDMGTTPQTLVLNRKANKKGDLPGKKSYAVRLELDGYQPYETKLERKFDGWIFGNLVFGGIIGVVIDLATGSVYRISPKRVDGDFLSNSSTTKSGIRIGVTMQPDPSWEKIGQMTRLSK